MSLAALQHVGSSQTGDRTLVSCTGKQNLYHQAPGEAQVPLESTLSLFPWSSFPLSTQFAGGSPVKNRDMEGPQGKGSPRGLFLSLLISFQHSVFPNPAGSGLEKVSSPKHLWMYKTVQEAISTGGRGRQEPGLEPEPVKMVKGCEVGTLSDTPELLLTSLPRHFFSFNIYLSLSALGLPC